MERPIDGAKSVLVVYRSQGPLEDGRLTIGQHVRALEASEVGHSIVYYNSFEDWQSRNQQHTPLPIPERIAGRRFDAVILHNTFLGYRWAYEHFYTWKQAFSWIPDLNCLIIGMPQDEYNHYELLDEWLFDWGVSVVLTNFSVETRQLLHPLLYNRAAFYECFTGYIDEASAKQLAGRVRPNRERQVDIVYRAKHLPYHLGSAGQLKHLVGDVVAARSPEHGLTCDVSTRAEDVIVGEKWLDFLASGRAVVGCESGSSVLDARGEIRAQIEAVLKKNPETSFDEAAAQMPDGWDSHRFFAISPRHFEAVIARTCQMLVEGNYNGVLQPDRHYIPIRRDLSNLDEALERLQDHHAVAQMVEQAYQEIALSGKYTYRTLARTIELAIAEHSRCQYGRAGGVDEQDTALRALERQLIAERHNNALLQVRPLKAQEEWQARLLKSHEEWQARLLRTQEEWQARLLKEYEDRQRGLQRAQEKLQAFLPKAEEEWQARLLRAQEESSGWGKPTLGDALQLAIAAVGRKRLLLIVGSGAFVLVAIAVVLSAMVSSLLTMAG